ncbi:hypothetical protein MMC34_000230 [Xylographa carneopallida]|nr:hypothetical protein [Xylographa carneopallida]
MTSWDLQTDDAFWSCWMPRSAAQPSRRTTSMNFAQHVALLQSLSTRDKTLRAAMRACSFTCLSGTQDESNLRLPSMRLYGAALQEINHALRTHARMTSDAVLAACRFLAVCEIFRPDAGTTGLQYSGTRQIHLEGMNRIFQLRGAESSASRLGPGLRNIVRYLAIRIAITQDRPDLLLTGLANDIPPTSLEDELFRIIYRVPALLQRQNSVSKYAKAYGACYDLDLTIRELINDSIQEAKAFQEWEHKARMTCCELSGQNVQDKNITLLLASPACGVSMLLTVNRYWLASLLFSFKTEQTLALLSEVSPEAYVALPSWFNPHHFASNIIRVAPLVFRPEMGLWAVEQASDALGSAMSYFATNGRSTDPELDLLRTLQSSNKFVQLVSGYMSSISISD